MQVKQKYLYYVIGALVLFCGYICYVNYHHNTPHNPDLKAYKSLIDSLNTDNMRLTNNVLFREKLDSIRLKQLDSLSVENKRLFESREKIKKQIANYDKFKSVDINASADSMHSILSEAGFH